MFVAGRTAIDNLTRKFRNDRTVVYFLMILVLLDTAFISVHIVRGVFVEMGKDIGFLADPRFSLLKDRGYAEWFSYVKLSLTFALLLLVCIKRSASIYAVLAFIFLLVLIDDSLSVHEAGGHLLLDRVGRDTSLGIHVRDLGELATWALLGAVALVPFIYAYRRSRPKDASIATYFAGCLAMLVGFAIGADILHALAPTRALDGLFGIIEDGGETLVLSLTCAIALLVFRIHSRPLPAFHPGSRRRGEGHGWRRRWLFCPLKSGRPDPERIQVPPFGVFHPW